MLGSGNGCFVETVLDGGTETGVARSPSQAREELAQLLAGSCLPPGWGGLWGDVRQGRLPRARRAEEEALFVL